MRSILFGAIIALVTSLLLTPLLIRYLRRRAYGQQVRDDGPQTHLVKQGTPTMGGLVIVAATVLGYFGAHLISWTQFGSAPSVSGLLVLYLFVGLGLVGFLDDYIKIAKQRSLGLNKTAKLVGQLFVSISFAVMALNFKTAGIAPAAVTLSFVRDIAVLSLGSIGFVVFAVLFISGFSNATNLTDGLDGLAAGASTMVFGAYTVISFWQFNHQCLRSQVEGCYPVRDPLDLALLAAAMMGACFGFLWWNANPARIYMGDTGSLALGGGMAGFAIISRTELLLFVLGALFVAVTLSVALQVAFFKATGRRIFRMAPLHHHFELAGWTEMTVVVRFWIVTGAAVALGLGIFYADWLGRATLQ